MHGLIVGQLNFYWLALESMKLWC